ncbi:hypothetical protein Lalb_Chr11g0075261 [Lupinus albus]|uniref:Uncharacterized protein n=1 Tax=Lupinus albus TaxID=3870 RepID=A0A6A4PTF9_LUPAL|nr:hypothetical protein Lalb_Chr11g0075261 [Lupinus albus]
MVDCFLKNKNNIYFIFWSKRIIMKTSIEENTKNGRKQQMYSTRSRSNKSV